MCIAFVLPGFMLLAARVRIQNEEDVVRQTLEKMFKCKVDTSRPLRSKHGWKRVVRWLCRSRCHVVDDQTSAGECNGESCPVRPDQAPCLDGSTSTHAGPGWPGNALWRAGTAGW